MRKFETEPKNVGKEECPPICNLLDAILKSKEIDERGVAINILVSPTKIVA